MESLKSRAASMPWPTASCPSYLQQTGLVASASSTSGSSGWTVQDAEQSTAAVVFNVKAAALPQLWQEMQGACVDSLLEGLKAATAAWQVQRRAFGRAWCIGRQRVRCSTVLLATLFSGN